MYLVKKSTIEINKIELNKINVGDIVCFTLLDGEEIEAMAVEQQEDGTIFCTVDCLAKEYPMFNSFKDMTDDFFTYENSDLCKALNGEILARFPEEIKSRMVALDNRDMLRIPTEREIFGENPYGQEEPDTVKRWKPMKKRRNRIAFQGKEGAWEWYWMMNRHKEYASLFVNFANANHRGNATSTYALFSGGVRPVFKLN